MSTANPLRVSAGVPNGGQFANDPRHESGMELDDPAIGVDTPGIADRLGIDSGERITSRHPDFAELDGTSRVVEDEYGEIAEHAVTLYHHLPSGRLLAAETVGDPYAPNYDGAPDPTGADLFEITSADQITALDFAAHVAADVSRHLAEVPVIDDSAHLTPARIQQHISSHLPDGVSVVPGSVSIPAGSFGREVPGARGPNPAEVQLSAHLSKGRTEYHARVEDGAAVVQRRNVFGGTTTGTEPLSDATPGGVGRAITTALAQSDLKDQQRAELVATLRSRLPVSYEPPFREDAGGGFTMTVPLHRTGPGLSSKPRVFGVRVSADGQVTVGKNSLTPGALPLGSRTTQIPSDSEFPAAADTIVNAVHELRF